jgi:putative flavoprotein involved in K+ transport
MQLIGTPERATLDLNALRTLAVRLAGIRDETALFSGSLPNVCVVADQKRGRLLDAISRMCRPGRGRRRSAAAAAD